MAVGKEGTQSVIGDTAWARTHSVGTTKVVESGGTHPEGNQELFIFKRDSEHGWKNLRYIFTTTNPGS